MFQQKETLLKDMVRMDLVLKWHLPQEFQCIP